MGKKIKLIIWGLGAVGSSTLRGAIKRDNLEIVGVKVFTSNKDNKDAGKLAGVGEIGVLTTTSKQKILDIEADCVIYTGQVGSMVGEMTMSDLDDDVIDLLESGKNVITTSAYHNVTLPNWASSQRPSAKQLQAACQKGGVSLLGTGVHPTFMVERLAMTLSRCLTKVNHVRCMEALSFAMAPANMWGGLDSLGFGLKMDQVNDASALARFGDIYYGAIVGNVAYALYGTRNEEIRVECTLNGFPAKEDFVSRKTGFEIKKGRVAGLHMVHKGFIGDHNFFTNEEVWYMGVDNLCLEDKVPFKEAPLKGLDYIIEIEGEPANLQSRYHFKPVIMEDPVTTISVISMLNAVGPVCEAPPDVLMDSTQFAYIPDDRI